LFKGRKRKQGGLQERRHSAKGNSNDHDDKHCHDQDDFPALRLHEAWKRQQGSLPDSFDRDHNRQSAGGGKDHHQDHCQHNRLHQMVQPAAGSLPDNQFGHSGEDDGQACAEACSCRNVSCRRQ